MFESHLQQTDELIQTSQALPYHYDRPPDDSWTLPREDESSLGYGNARRV